MSLLIMPIPASATNQTAADDAVAAKSMAQAPALEAFNKIYDLLIFDTEEAPAYHDYYSGSYINDDNVLVICVKTGGTELVNTINNALGNEYDVEYEFCEWSKNEVLAFAQSEISTFSTKENVTVSGGYYRAQDNAYILEVINTSEHPIFSTSATRERSIPVIIREIEASPVIASDTSVLDSAPNNVTANSNTPIYGGTGMYQRIFYGDDFTGYTQMAATVGLCGYFNTVPCILTAAHCCMENANGSDKRLYLDSTFDDELVETSLEVHGDGDYAALEIPPEYTPTNRIIASSSGSILPISSYFTAPEIPQNTIIYKYGITTQCTASKVSGNNGTSGSYPSTISHLIVSSPINGNTANIVAEGDSGGPVWMMNTSGGIILVGIVQAKSNADNQMYTTPIRFPIGSGFIPYGMINTFI